jgi:uncharacterized protein with HEPN domain
MRHDDRVYVAHMIEFAQKAHVRVAKRERADLDADEDLQLQLYALIERIGEAAAHVQPAFREQHPELNWQEIVGMRHKLIHEYFRIDLDVVWKAAKDDAPELIELLTPLVPAEWLEKGNL